MLPGFRRTQWAPASIAFSASVWLKWMSAITGIGDSRDDRLQRLDVLLARHRDAHDVGAGLGDRADLLHRRREVGGLGLGHRLHGDRRAAADRDGADVDLALGGHRLDSTMPERLRTPRAARSRASPEPLAAARPRPPPRALLRARRGCAAGARACSTSAAARSACARSSRELDITGVDLVARPDYPGPFVRADAAAGLPFADGEFDLVYCSSVIEHVAAARGARRSPPSCAASGAAGSCRRRRCSFPIEPHALLPVAHWLPAALRRRYWRLGAAGDWEEISLLRRARARGAVRPGARRALRAARQELGLRAPARR